MKKRTLEIMVKWTVLRITLLGAALLTLMGCLESNQEAIDPVSWEVVAKLEQAPGNLTVTGQGRILFSMHQHFAPELRMAELDPSSATKNIPFPNKAMASDAEGEPLGLNSVLGVQTDSNGTVWMLDNAMRGGDQARLVGWMPGGDGDSGSLVQAIDLPDSALSERPFLNDLAVDLSRNVIYIADTSRSGTPALIVVDLESGTSRRVLENHVSVEAEAMPMIADGAEVQIRRDDGTTFNPQVAVNPIALDAAGEYLYYGPMTGTILYRVPTRALLNTELTESELAAAVEAWAERPISDGISIDQAGNVYISAVGQNEIGVILAESREYVSLIQDERISWPDAFSYGPDGYLYAVVNQLHRGPLLNAGKDQTEPPFLIIRFKPLAAGVVGR